MGVAMFDVVVVGADFSPTARRAVVAATELVLMSKGSLHIVTAYDAKTKSVKQLPSEFANKGQGGGTEAALQDLSFVAKKLGVDPVLHLVEGEPAKVIVDLADKVNADTIVVGNRGMKGVRRVLGSVPNSVAHEANCSVIIIDTTE
jgi:nucleotide-binding universal stress UspA family protein